METTSRKALLETIDTAIEYSAKLDRNLNSVLGAEQQVIETAEESLSDIDSAFDEITKCVLDALNKRRETLKNNVNQIREGGLKPLRACRELITHTLKNTQNYICEGQDLLSQLDSQRVDAERCLKFFDQSSLLGNLPAVPALEEVPAITVQLSVESLCSQLVSTVSAAGRVYRMGPVQITSVTDKPGALLVHWEEVEERGIDEPCFRLQIAAGSHGRQSAATVYRDVYQGGDTCAVVRDLRQGELYTLRVSCKDEHGDWCASSLPQTVFTVLPPFRWSTNSPHYETSVEGKIATKSDSVKSILFSSINQFGPDHSIEFTVLECPEGRQPCEGLGLVDVTEMSDTLVQRGCLFLNDQGCIFVDGVEKTTRLPPLGKVCRVTFTCEPLDPARVRVHVDAGGKAVTYDWRVSSTSLHFATLCALPGWTIMVE